MSAPPSKLSEPSSGSPGAGFEFYLGQRRQVKENAQRKASLYLVRILDEAGGEYKLLGLPEALGIDVFDLVNQLKEMMAMDLISIEGDPDKPEDAIVVLTDSGKQLIKVSAKFTDTGETIDISSTGTSISSLK